MEQGVVTINTKSWEVSVATLPLELVQGLGGISSIPSETGMLFDTGIQQSITVTTEAMLFPIDIAFISEALIITDIYRNVSPGLIVDAEHLARYFLEVNVNELEGIEVGNSVDITIAILEVPSWDTWVYRIQNMFMTIFPFIILGVFTIGMAKMITEHHSNEMPLWERKELEHLRAMRGAGRRYGGPRTEEERALVHKEFYGTKKVPPRGTGLGERGESIEGRRLGEPKTEEERREAHYRKYGTREAPERGKGLKRLHHSAKYPEYIHSASRITGFISDAAGIAIEAEGEAEKAVTFMQPINPHFYKHFDLDIRKIRELASRSAVEYGVAGKGIVAEYLPQTLFQLESIGRDLHSLDEAVYRNDEDGASDKWGDIGVRAWELAGLQDEAVIDAYERLSGEKSLKIEDNVEVYTSRVIPERIAQDTGLHIDPKTEGRYTTYYYGPDLAYFERDLRRLLTERTGYPALGVTAYYIRESEQRSIHGEPRVRLVEKYGSWAVGRAEAICPEDDIACVEREAKRLIETIRGRYGEERVKYVTITSPGKTVFHVGDVVSLVAFEKENERVRALGEKEAIGEISE